MRTTPLVHWESHAAEFDRGVRQAAEAILGVLFDDRAYAQAALTPSLGGLGLRRVVEHADGAFAASCRLGVTDHSRGVLGPATTGRHTQRLTDSGLSQGGQSHPRQVGSGVSVPPGVSAAYAVVGRARGGLGDSGRVGRIHLHHLHHPLV